MSFALERANRVVVYGVAGAGKTYTAARLADRLNVPLHRVDDEIGWLAAADHGAWQLRPQDEIRAKFREVAAERQWVLDGVYESSIPDVIGRADAVVCLDYSRWRILAQITRRTFKRLVFQEQICNGNLETARNVFSSGSPIIYTMRKFRSQRTLMRSWASSREVTTVTLRRPSDLDNLLTR